jgi:hypothetical protein
MVVAASPDTPSPCDCQNHPARDVAPRLNDLAVVALITAIICWPVGAVVALVARRELRRTRERGLGLTVAALIVSAVAGAFWSLLTLVLIVMSLNGSPSVPRCAVTPFQGSGTSISCTTGFPRSFTKSGTIGPGRPVHTSQPVSPATPIPFPNQSTSGFNNSSASQ